MTTTEAPTAPALRIRYNKSSIHIQGLGEAGNYGAHAGQDLGEGYVRYAPESHCPALTRSGWNMGVVTECHEDRSAGNGRVKRTYTDQVWTSATEALAAARLRSAVHGGRVCAKCEARAEDVAATEVPALSDEARAALVAEAATLRARLAEIAALIGE